SAWDSGLHVTRTGSRDASRQAGGHLVVWGGFLRDVDRETTLRWGDHERHHGTAVEGRTRLEYAATRGSTADPETAATLSHQREARKAPSDWRSTNRDRR